MTKDTKELKEKLSKILSDAVQQDAELREKLGIGDKFKFVRDKLTALQSSVEEALATVKIESEEAKKELEEDEQKVYVYIFNAHGIDVQTWNKMLHHSVYYEYSVNRPIYGELDHIESVIRSKPDRNQHGYMTVAVKKQDVLTSGDSGTKDAIGVPMLKLKEGALKPERFINFMHNGKAYYLSEDNKLCLLDDDEKKEAPSA